MMVHDTYPVIEFTAEHRCDGCGARAHAMAKRDSAELYFCNHHLGDSYDNLLDNGWEIIEDQEAIDAMAFRRRVNSSPASV